MERLFPLHHSKSWEPQSCLDLRLTQVYAIIFFSTIGITIIIPTLPFVIIELKQKAGLYGILQSILSVMQTVSAVALGWISDLVGIEITIVCSLLISCIGQYSLFTAYTNNMLCISRILGGLGFQITLFKIFFCSLKKTGEKLQRFGIIGAIQGLSLGIGPLLGGFLGSIYGNRFVLFVSFLSYFFAFTISISWYVHTCRKPPEKEIASGDTSFEEEDVLIKREDELTSGDFHNEDGFGKIRLCLLCIMNLMFRLVFACYKTIFVFLCHDRLEYTSKEVGVLLSVAGFHGIFVQGVLTRISLRCLSPQTLLQISMMTLAVSFASMGHSRTDFAITTAVIGCTTGYGLSLPTFSAMFSDYPISKGKLMGFAGMIDRLGQTFGSICGGILVEAFGNVTVIYSAALTLAITTIFTQSQFCVHIWRRLYELVINYRMTKDYDYKEVLISEDVDVESVKMKKLRRKSKRLKWFFFVSFIINLGCLYFSGIFSRQTNPEEPFDLIVDKDKKADLLLAAQTYPKIVLNNIDINWLQVIGEGWAAPLRGFMRESELLQSIHFKSILVEPNNLTSSKPTSWTQDIFPSTRVSMPVPIVLPINQSYKDAIANHQHVSLTSVAGNILAVLHHPEVYNARYDEVIAHIWGAVDKEHPYLKEMFQRPGAKYFVGGEIELIEKIKYNDGYDKYRKTAKEVKEALKRKKADVVFAFQTRNPTHAGHAFLMKQSRDNLLKQGYKNPVLWLSPLGGWTKMSDVPLDVRINQHEEVIKAGELDSSWTFLSIWPAPMMYAGPTEVQFHAKSRRIASATFFTVGRDPAGMPFSSGPKEGEDMYDPDHGRHVLAASPGLNNMKLIGFDKVYYDKRDHTMKSKDISRPDDFISISGSKMRKLASIGAKACPMKIPSNLVKAKCIPPGFMVPKGWDIVSKYYMNINKKKWIQFSKFNI